MRKIIAVLALVATVSLGFAQETPKAETKKETCPKSKKCCKDKVDATAVKTTAVKK